MSGKNSRKKLKQAGCWFLIIAVLTAAFAGIFVMSPAQLTPDEIIPNNSEIVGRIKEDLKNHCSTITVTFYRRDDISGRMKGFADSWMREAVADSDDPAGGDYIRYQMGGYETNYTCEEKDGGFFYTVHIIPRYYSYLIQEEEASEKLTEIMESFGFDEMTSDYEKIRTVYDYLCSSVKYDLFHRKNRLYSLRSTSYAALVKKSATCQGYCVTLYRMLKMEGINTRVITGFAQSVSEGNIFHAWNIVELDGRWYCLDPTWDAGNENYRFFLKGSEDFKDHTPGSEFQTKAFLTAHPVSAENYEG